MGLPICQGTGSAGSCHHPAHGRGLSRLQSLSPAAHMTSSPQEPAGAPGTMMQAPGDSVQERPSQTAPDCSVRFLHALRFAEAPGWAIYGVDRGFINMRPATGSTSKKSPWLNSRPSERRRCLCSKCPWLCDTASDTVTPQLRQVPNQDA